MYKSEKFWDRIAKKFDNQGKKSNQSNIKIIENSKKHLNKNDIILDYGCATGTISIDLADNVKEIHAIDISSKMIESAKRKASERTIENINFYQSTIFDAEFKKESFNAILSFNILHLLENPTKGIKKINELLKPGGLFISVTPCLKENKTFLNFVLFPLSKIGIIPHIIFFNISELENLISKENFQIVETEIHSNTSNDYLIVAKKK